jgi:hypothetical protein
MKRIFKTFLYIVVKTTCYVSKIIFQVSSMDLGDGLLGPRGTSRIVEQKFEKILKRLRTN